MAIFKTSLADKKDLSLIEPAFNILFGEKNWLFAFENKVLSVVSSVPCVEVVRHLLKEQGFSCEEMNAYALV